MLVGASGAAEAGADATSGAGDAIATGLLEESAEPGDSTAT